jgi:hypothetical protein
MSIQAEFDKLLEERAELNKKFQIKAQELFKETTKEFFDKNPGITAVIWTQYTPFFNDGDTCEFSVGEPSFTNAEGDDLDDCTSYGEYEGDNESVWCEGDWILTGDSDYTKERRKNMDMSGVDIASVSKFSGLIQSGDMEDVMEAMFGDHVRVIATRDGFDVNDHDHD